VDSGQLVIADPKVLQGDYSKLERDFGVFKVPVSTYRCK